MTFLLQPKSRCLAVVIGMDGEIGSEAKLQNYYSDACEIFGVDPVASPNRGLLELIGGKFTHATIRMTNNVTTDSTLKSTHFLTSCVV